MCLRVGGNTGGVMTWEDEKRLIYVEEPGTSSSQRLRFVLFTELRRTAGSVWILARRGRTG